MTLDLNTLLRVLLEEFGEHIELQVDPMTEEERAAAEDRTRPITKVTNRLMIFDLSNSELPVRREDLEQRIVQQGRK